MRHAGERNALAEEQVPAEQSLVAVVAVDGAGGLLLHQLLELRDEALVAFVVVRRVGEHDVARRGRA